MIDPAQIIEALPVIVSLVVIEGLLSVDNALVIAALASDLPKHQQAFALRVGLFGAYLFRGLAMLLVSFIIANPWLKLLGSTYLIYLMASNLAGSKEKAAGVGTAKTRQRSLFVTILQIEIMDLALSLDNVVAAVALDKRIWVVCTGVFIGILALRFLAGLCIRLIKKFPTLGATAFLLIGFVGVILLVETGSELGGHPLHINSLEKFLGIAGILALSLLYDRSPLVRTILEPVVAAGTVFMTALNKVFGVFSWLVGKGR